MQPHNEWRDLGLQLADAFDTMVAHGARARLHAQAAFARLLQGKEPIDFVRGPATPHARARRRAAGAPAPSTRRRSRAPARRS